MYAYAAGSPGTFGALGTKATVTPEYMAWQARMAARSDYEVLVTEIERQKPAAWYEHFAFGVMRRNAAIKLIHVHTRHHLAIVKDILAKETP